MREKGCGKLCQCTIYTTRYHASWQVSESEIQINIWQSTMNQKKSYKNQQNLVQNCFICHPSFQEKVSDPAVQFHWNSGARLTSKVGPPTVMQARERGQIRRNTMNHSKTLILQNMSSICRFSSLKKGSWVWSLDSTVRRHSGSLTFMQASNKERVSQIHTSLLSTQALMCSLKAAHLDTLVSCKGGREGTGWIKWTRRGVHVVAVAVEVWAEQQT